VPGSSLVISDEGLGEETGEGTDFVVVTPVVRAQRIADDRGLGRRARYPYDDVPVYAPTYRNYYPYSWR
jgi:hypothetical protein